MKTRFLTFAFSLAVSSAAFAAEAPATPSTPAAPGKPAVAAEYPTEFRTESGAVVKRSMTAAEVVAILGEPKEKRPLKTGDGMAEVWVYRRESVKGSAPKTISSEITVTSDNGEGFVRTIDVPTYRLEQTTEVEIRELLMFHGRLLNWKETRGLKRAVQ